MRSIFVPWLRFKYRYGWRAQRSEIFDIDGLLIGVTIGRKKSKWMTALRSMNVLESKL